MAVDIASLPATRRVKLTEIFLSIQGEADAVGWPTVFIRLTGCPLRCGYCDTTYSFYGGDWHAIDTVLQQVKDYGVRHVCVTGGEPLAQQGCVPLLKSLCDADYQVSLETSGAMDISVVDVRVSRVMDLKTPGSGELNRNRYENIPLLTSHDQLKFVLCDRADYEWACEQVKQQQLDQRCTVLFSAVHGQIAARELAEWILADRLPVRMQVQLHKYLWGDEKGR
ncbi:MAG: 7-carboxy-7-deazaguanine synthase QueE [Steroidobacter sp.]